MKIAFLVTGLDKPSVRYRVLQYIPYLEKAGFTADVHTIPGNYLRRISLFKSMKNYECVILHRRLLSSAGFYVLRKYSSKLVYDFDDALMFRDSSREKFFSYKREKNFFRTVKYADMVIAGNDYLGDFALKENARTHIIPTTVDTNRFTEKPPRIHSNQIILGWIGSSSTLFYLENLKGLFDRVFERFPFTRLKIVADRFFECEEMPVIKKPWKYDEEIDDLHSFDIGLMPLTDDPWSRGKCGFKILQYMALGIPSVCSPVGANRKIVSDGMNGFWAEDEDEWTEKMALLIQDRELRARIGRKGRETVAQYYATGANSDRLIALLLSLFKK